MAKEVFHLARGCFSIRSFDDPADRDEALLTMLKAEVAENLAAGHDIESSSCEYPYAVDISGHRAEMFHMSVNEDGVIDELAFVQDAEWSTMARRALGTRTFGRGTSACGGMRCHCPTRRRRCLHWQRRL
ncbi:hypothetical protein [Aureimonas glaciei]|uniref:Uncharacterized protein n=1 Tax=Aureimonas glaciei TaxID=1776957 RepID=A0A916Y558_9HYPH|nr:hypothetical protein [Aureimonas glaciei]GGD31300.1 hypothetical protein GCM10011335_37890 [Aureimonas glaciei]